MSNVVDPEAVKFIREQIRPIAEQSRAITMRIRSALAKWNGNADYGVTGISTLIPDGEGFVEENRTAEGVGDLSCANINSIMRGLAIAEAAYDDGLMEKACVRTLSAD